MQRRRLLKVLGIISLIGLAIGIGALAVGRQHYTRFVEESLRTEAARHGVRVATRNLEIFPFGVRASEIEVYFVRQFLSLTFGSVTTRLHDLTPSIEVTATAYGGSVRGDIVRPWLSRQLTAKAQLEDVKLVEHPQCNALGITGGTIGLNVSEAQIDTSSNLVERARFDATVSGFERSTPLVIPAGRFGAPLGFTIPPIPPSDISASGSFERGRLTLTRISLATPLGTVSAAGEITLNNSKDVSLDALISLSSEGSVKLGPYLPVVSQGVVDAGATKIRLVAQGPLHALRMKWSRAG